MSGHVIRPPAFARTAARATTGTTPRAAVSGIVRLWFGLVARMSRAVEERRLLATLDDRMLADIGVSRAEANREANRAPWDLTDPR